MIRSFEMNGIEWSVIDVPKDSSLLIDRTGVLTVAVTDPLVHSVYISSEVTGSFRCKVLIHEICHCALVSYGLLSYIHHAVKPEYWIEAEEWLCNLMADYGGLIFANAFNVLGYDALSIVPAYVGEYASNRRIIL